MSWSPLNALRAVRELDLKPPQKLVLYALVSRCDSAGLAYPGASRLAKDTGMHERTCRRAAEQLEAGGFISRTWGKGTAYTYDLTPLTPGAVSPRTEGPPRAERPTTPDRGPGVPRTERPDTPGGAPDEVVHEVAQEKKTRKGSRGARLPEDWAPAESDYTYAQSSPSVAFGRAIVDDQAEAFRLYWHSATRNATKRDWSAAFKLWLRRHRERHPNLPRYQPPRPKAPPPADVLPPDPDRLASLLIPTGTESP